MIDIEDDHREVPEEGLRQNSALGYPALNGALGRIILHTRLHAVTTQVRHKTMLIKIEQLPCLNLLLLRQKQVDELLLGFPSYRCTSI